MLILASHAFATPCAPTTYDDDGDCYFTNVSPEDCDDTDDSINPGAPENGVDRTDDDCDGLTTIRREFVSGFETLDDFTPVGLSSATCMGPPPRHELGTTPSPLVEQALTGFW